MLLISLAIKALIPLPNAIGGTRYSRKGRNEGRLPLWSGEEAIELKKARKVGVYRHSSVILVDFLTIEEPFLTSFLQGRRGLRSHEAQPSRFLYFYSPQRRQLMAAYR
jgi:hypothetical protein